jgi:hypothetical protein
MLSSKKIDLEGDFAAGVYLSAVQNPIPPSHTHCIRVYRIVTQTGKAVELNQRDGS